MSGINGQAILEAVTDLGHDPRDEYAETLAGIGVEHDSAVAMLSTIASRSVALWEREHEMPLPQVLHFLIAESYVIAFSIGVMTGREAKAEETIPC